MTLLLDTLVDVSRPLHEGMAVWPGDTPFRREVFESPGAGDTVTASALTLSSHAGTHVDAPLHSDPAGAAVESLALERFVGPALVIDARGRQALEEELLPQRSRWAGWRVLFRTDYARAGAFRGPAAAASRASGPHESPASVPAQAAAAEYGPHVPYFTPGLARALVAGGVPLVGVDGPSVDPFRSTALEAHRILGWAGVAILEHLDLGSAEPGEWILIALPLRIAGGDASPVRAVLLKEAG